MPGMKSGSETRRVVGGSLLVARPLAGLVGLLAGCGQFKYPEATTPPEWAVTGERAPEFTVFAEDPLLPGNLSEVHSKDFEGRILVAMGAEPGFAGELVPWLDLLHSKYDRWSGPGVVSLNSEGGGRYAVLVIVERADPGWLARLRLVMPEGLTMLLDPEGEFANAPKTEDNRFGFVGEGPHIAVISADGTLLALIDGPVSEKRLERLIKAMDRAFSLLEEKPEAN